MIKIENYKNHSWFQCLGRSFSFQKKENIDSEEFYIEYIVVPDGEQSEWDYFGTEVDGNTSTAKKFEFSGTFTINNVVPEVWFRINTSDVDNDTIIGDIIIK